MAKEIDHSQVFIEPRTLEFIEQYNILKAKGEFSSNEELAAILGYRRPSSITEILSKRQNIPPGKYRKFLQEFELTENSVSRETSTAATDQTAILNLTESNRLMAESNASLAKSNEELVRMVKDSRNSTGNVSKETNEVVVASLNGLREFVLEQFVRKDKFQSYEEADAVLNKKIGASLRNMKEKDTQIG